jgi:tRNA(adenine34) deaminase
LTEFPDCDVEALMREAIREAEAAADAGDLPIGAVVALHGEVVGRGRSRKLERRTQLAHAELDALLDAGEAIYEHHDDAVVFTTVEPCPMCLGAVVMADVPHVVFACPDANAGVPAMLDLPYVNRHIATYRGGVLEGEARAVIERTTPRLLAYLDGA